MQHPVSRGLVGEGGLMMMMAMLLGNMKRSPGTVRSPLQVGDLTCLLWIRKQMQGRSCSSYR